VWGTSPFQSIYDTSSFPHNSGFFQSFLAFSNTPEWYLVIALLGLISLLGFFWEPLFLAFPILLVAAAYPTGEAMRAAAVASRHRMPPLKSSPLAFMLVTSFLHRLQPLARLAGRLGRGIHPLASSELYFALPRVRVHPVWREKWGSPQGVLEDLERDLVARGTAVTRGGAFDNWDLEIHHGVTASLRVRVADEQHPKGRQLLRLRSWPRWSRPSIAIALVFISLSGLAALNGAGWASAVLAALGLGLVARGLLEASLASGLWLQTVNLDKKDLS